MNIGSPKLNQWLATYFPVMTLSVASSDASNRCYFRLKYDNKSCIVMDSSQELATLKQFITVHTILSESDIYVPKILYQATELGFLVLEDLGNITFLMALKQGNVLTLYQHSIDILIQLQQIKTAVIPDYDANILQREMSLFPEWYLQKHHKILLNSVEKNQLKQCFLFLSQKILQQPKVLVHRDYHSRNIMQNTGQKLALIDFQDALVGSYVYDLCSLLKDAYYQLPHHLLARLLEYYYQQSSSNIPFKQYLEDFELISIQRQLKVLGIFTRLSLRDSKTQYLTNIPLVEQYLLPILAKYPALTFVHQLLLKTSV